MLFFLVSLACKDGVDEPVPHPTLDPPAAGTGFQLAMETSVEPFTEAWMCSVYPIPITETAPVNWMDFVQTPNLHHMTLSTPSLFGTTSLTPGMYDCNDIYSTMLEDQVTFYGNQGFADGEMHLPDGVAATFPPNINVLHEIHYVNTTDVPVDIYSYVNAYTIPSDEVVSGIWGGQVRDEHIEIPASASHTEWSRCVMNEDVDVLFLASHTHGRGREVTIKPFDGTTVGDEMYRNIDWHDPKITQYDPPLHIAAGTGFEWSCTWQNDDATPVTYGLTANDEMCNMTLVHTPFSMTAQCEVVETSDGVLWVP